MLAADLSECTPRNPFWHLYFNRNNKLFQAKESVFALRLCTRGLNFCGRYDLKDNMTSDGVWVLLRTNRLAMFKAWEPKAKLLRSIWNWNLVKPNLSYSGIPRCKICRTALTLGWSNLLWWQPPNVQKIYLAGANWKAAFISLRELHIVWLGWSQIAESTDNWLWQSEPCLEAYPLVSVATTEL